MRSFDILVVGDGLSSLLFCYGFQQNKKVKVDVLSPNFKNELKDQNYKTKDKLKIPYHFTSKKNFRDIKNYFVANKITFDKKKLEICGILGRGGLSNYWGAQVDLNNTEDLNFLGKGKLSEIKKIIKEFKDYKKIFCNLKVKQNELLFGNKNLQNYFFEEKINDLNIKYPTLAYNNLVKLSADSFKKKFINNQQFRFHNYCLDKILRKNKNYIEILVTDPRGNKEKFKTRYLILGCGTIITTKLVLEYLKIKEKVRIYHHPRQIVVSVCNRLFSKNDKIVSQVYFEDKKKNFLIDFRPGNLRILKSINYHLFKYDLVISFFNLLLFPFRKIFTCFIFSNLLLGPEKSQIFMQLKKDTFYLSSKKDLKINFSKFKKIIKKTFLLKQIKIFNIFFPNSMLGNDYHYFGSLRADFKKSLIDKESKLKKNKNIIICDGSNTYFKKNKFPLGLIMANSYRLGRNFNFKKR